MCDFVTACRERTVTALVAANNTRRSSVLDGRTSRHGSNAVSQVIRMRVEGHCGWGSTDGHIRHKAFR